MMEVRRGTPRGSTSSGYSPSSRHGGVVAKVRTAHHLLVADGKRDASSLPAVSVSALERALSAFLQELRQAQADELRHGVTSSTQQGIFSGIDTGPGPSRAEREAQDQARVKANKLVRDARRLKREFG